MFTISSFNHRICKTFKHYNSKNLYHFINQKASELKTAIKPNQTDRWPTLEISPGGVIRRAVDCETFPAEMANKPPRKGEMMYACAKCSQVFKYLFCLTKHVKWHEDQNKLKAGKLKTMSECYLFLFTL